MYRNGIIVSFCSYITVSLRIQDLDRNPVKSTAFIIIF